MSTSRKKFELISQETVNTLERNATRSVLGRQTRTRERKITRRKKKVKSPGKRKVTSQRKRKVTSPPQAIITDQDKANWFKAVDRGNLTIIQTLLNKGIDVNITDDQGNTALWHASWGGKIEIVKKLLNTHGIDVNIRGSGSKMTALHTASEKGNVEIVRQLLKHPKINIYIRNTLDQFPIDVAEYFRVEYRNWLERGEDDDYILYNEYYEYYDYDYDYKDISEDDLERMEETVNLLKNHKSPLKGITEFKVKKLKQIAKELGLTAGGKKADLVVKIVQKMLDSS